MKKKTKKLKKKVIVNVSQKEFDAELARGISPEETLKPGRHIFHRGGFFKRHNVTPEQVRTAVAAAQSKISVSLRLDHDVLAFFKGRAADPLAAGYQTQINAVLRQYVEREKGSA